MPLVEDPADVGHHRRRADRARSRGCPAGGSPRSPTPAPGPRPRSAGCSTSPPRWQRPVTLLANLATRHLWGSHPARRSAAWLPARRRASRSAAGLGRRALRLRDRPAARSGWQPVRRGRHLSLARRRGRARAAAGALAAAIERRDRSRETLASGEHPRFGQPAGACSRSSTPRTRRRCARAPARSAWSRASGTTAP